MTQQEAVKILKGAIKKPNTKDGYLGQALDMAIKALEQQPSEDVLDKIRAEIERKANSGQWSDATMYGMLKAVAIIDKYREGSESE